MPPAELEPDAYMEAFMNGFDFVLLAMRGRLAEEAMPPEERKRLEGFLQDYSRIAEAYRQRRPAAGPERAVVVHGRMPAETHPAAVN